MHTQTKREEFAEKCLKERKDNLKSWNDEELCGGVVDAFEFQNGQWEINPDKLGEEDDDVHFALGFFRDMECYEHGQKLLEWD